MFWARTNDAVDDPDAYEQPDDDYTAHLKYHKHEGEKEVAVAEEKQQQQEQQQQHDDWTRLLNETCSTLGSLHATPQQVLDHATFLACRPKQSHVLLWRNKSVVPALVAAYRRTEERQSQQQRWWFTRVVQSWYQTAVVDATNWNQDEDDFQAELPVRWQDSVLQVDLAVQCCQMLAAANCVKLRQGEEDDQDTVLGWLARQEGVLSKLPQDQVNKLMEVLQELNLAQVVDDVVIFGSEDTDISIALFRLDRAIRQTERSMETWTKQRDGALTKASQFKRKNQTALAMQQLRRKALYEANLERARGTVLNLEQTRHAVVTAQSQAQVTRVLKDTTSVLKGLNAQVPVQHVDDLAVNLQEEYQHLKDVSTTLQQVNDRECDEAEMLKELEAMTIGDVEGSRDSKPLVECTNSDTEKLKGINTASGKPSAEKQSPFMLAV